MLNAVQGELGVLIKDGVLLHNLFRLSLQQLTEERRMQILNAVQGKLGNMIRDISELYDLFSLSPEQITEAQRTQILNAVQGKLGILIQYGKQFHALFGLSSEQFTPEHRLQVIDALGEIRFSELIPSAEERHRLRTSYTRVIQATNLYTMFAQASVSETGNSLNSKDEDEQRGFYVLN